MKATKITVEFDDNTTLYIQPEGAKAYRGAVRLPTAEIFEIVWDKFDRYRVVREALNLLRGQQLSAAIHSRLPYSLPEK
jgi:hypothetical protein